MINQGQDVPKNTILAFMDPLIIQPNQLHSIIKKPGKKRDWFPPNAYNCHPLLIANQYGFIITADFDFTVLWNGGQSPEDIDISYNFYNKTNDYDVSPIAFSHFGFGLLTVYIPIILRTPKGVNLLTINPPNHIIENATVLSGSVETDHSRVPFTFNLKIHQPNIPVTFKAGDPLSGFIPIPRYFADSFELKDATEVFDQKTIYEEIQATRTHDQTRANNNEKAKYTKKNLSDKNYFKGKDPYGNKFPDHQNL
jgi:hypothetical protein